MFDLRYHVASLAAVFVALLIGILVGVGLIGKRIGLLFVGSPDEELRASVTTALEDAGARDVTRMRALKVPINADRLASTLRTRPALARYAGDENLRELGRVLAQEFVLGGDAPAWDALSTQLVVNQRGTAGPPLDG